MSTILKALRRVEEDRRPPPERPLREQVIAMEPGRPVVRPRARWPRLALLGALAAGLVGALVWLGVPVPFDRARAPEARLPELAAARPGAPEGPGATPSAADSPGPPAAALPSRISGSPAPPPAPPPRLAPVPPDGEVLGAGVEVPDLPPDIPTVSARPSAAPRPAPRVAARIPAPPAEPARAPKRGAADPARAPSGPPASPAVARNEVPGVVEPEAPSPAARSGAAAGARADRSGVEASARPAMASPARETGAKGAPPAVAAAPPLPVVLRTRWHPRPEERAAWLATDPAGSGEPVAVREGDRVLGFAVERIEPSAVVLARGDERLRRRVGER